MGRSHSIIKARARWHGHRALALPGVPGAARLGFDEDVAPLTEAPADDVEKEPRLVELLASYNRGELCL